LQERAPEWAQLIKFCNFKEKARFGGASDRRPSAVESSHPYDPYSTLRAKFRRMRSRAEEEGEGPTEEEQMKIIKAAMDDVRTLVWDHKQFIRAVEVIKEKGRKEEVGRSEGRILNLVVVESDEHHTNTAARAYFKADVVIQMNTSGHVHIFTRNGAVSNLDDLAQALKIEEQRVSEVVYVADWKRLRNEGRAFDGDLWYYARRYGQLHNGTEHHSDFSPTQLSLEVIVALVKETLDVGHFEYTDCSSGNCHGDTCPMYYLGCQRCRRVRWKMHGGLEEEDENGGEGEV
jgi:hypothetical protein